MIDLTKFSIVPVTGTEIIAIGIVATLTMDLWQRFLQVIGLPPTNWGLVERWVGGFSRGVFTHRPITAAPKVAGEAAIGWAFHYAVGIAYAALYLAIMKLGFGSGPTLLSALVVRHAAGPRPRFHGGTYSQSGYRSRDQRIRARGLWAGPLSRRHRLGRGHCIADCRRMASRKGCAAAKTATLTSPRPQTTAGAVGLRMCCTAIAAITNCAPIASHDGLKPSDISQSGSAAGVYETTVRSCSSCNAAPKRLMSPGTPDATAASLRASASRSRSQRGRARHRRGRR